MLDLGACAVNKEFRPEFKMEMQDPKSTLASRLQQSSSRKHHRVTSRFLCPHCDQDLTIKTLKRHKSLFLKSDGTWMKENVRGADSDDAAAAAGSESKDYCFQET